MVRKQILWLRLLFWTIFIFVLCIVPIPKSNGVKLVPHLDKVAHFGLFFLFSAFAYGWLRESNKRFSKSMSVCIILLLTAIYGGLIEWLQGAYFARSADVWDWVADVVGGILGIICYPLLHKWRSMVENRLHKLIG